MGNLIVDLKSIASWTRGYLTENRKGVMCLVFGVLVGLGYAFSSLPIILYGVLLLFLLVMGLRDHRNFYYIVVLFIFWEHARLEIHQKPFLAYFYVANVFSVLVFVIHMMNRLAGGGLKRQATPLDLVLFGLLWYYGITLTWCTSEFLVESFIVYFFLNYCMFYISGVIVNDSKVFIRSVFAWIVGGVICAIGIVASEYIELEKTWVLAKNIKIYLAMVQTVERPSGFAYCNTVAAAVVPPILMLLGVLQYVRTKKAKFFLLTLIFFLFYALILTESRGGVIGLVGGFFFFFLFNPRYRGKQIRTLICVFLFSGMTLLITDPSFIDRILVGFGYSGELLVPKEGNNTFSGGQSTRGLTGIGIRLYWWKSAFEKVKEKPYRLLFGYGQTSYLQQIKYLEHSILMGFFFDAGVIGILLMMLIFVIVMSNVFQIVRHPREQKEYYLFLGVISGVIAILGIHGLINFDLIALPVWFIFGYCMAVINVVKRALYGRDAVAVV